MKKLIITSLILLAGYGLQAQVNATLVRDIDINENQIAFVFGGDVWLVSSEGGQAVQLTSSPGEETRPHFSPDGKWLAYSAAYDGNMDVYLLPVAGGIPKRLTYHSGADQVIGWHPNGDKVLFNSSRYAGHRRGNSFYLVSTEGGNPERMQIPYGEWGSFSPDGKQFAYVMRMAENYPFKRYKGGLNSDVIIYNLQDNTAERITVEEAHSTKPVWIDEKVYFLSDRGENMRRNIWSWNTRDKKLNQLTNDVNFDIMNMSGSGNSLVYELGGKLFVYDLSSSSSKEISINVVSDLTNEMGRMRDVSNWITNFAPGPEGKRIIVEARGELFNIPEKNGYKLTITNSSGAFDRDPSWSPDGKYVAYWSDKSGENEIYLHEPGTSKPDRKLTSRNGGFGYQLTWSPDSEKICFVDEKNDLYVVQVPSGQIRKIDNLVWNLSHPGRLGFTVDWSPDSRWVAYSVGQENANNAIIVYDTEQNKRMQLTSGYYNDFDPAFSTDGKYLFYLTNRAMNSVYSSIDATWVYPNSTQLAGVALQQKTESLLKSKNDGGKGMESGNENERESESESESENERERERVLIEAEGFEGRAEILSVESGNLRNLNAFEGKVVYNRFPNSGSGSGQPPIIEFYDIADRKTKTIVTGASNYLKTPDGKKILAGQGRSVQIISPAEGQKLDKPIDVSELMMSWVPREEWHQLFADAWRRHRDFFYDPNMHGLDWQAIRNQYEPLIDEARTRWDVNFIISEMNAELSAGHTYTRGGDTERVNGMATGLLGIEWEADGDYYKIKRIVKPAEWDTEVRSPFDKSGISVEEGMYILQVNNIDITTDLPPYAFFQGLSGKTVSLMVSNSKDINSATEIIVDCLSPGQDYLLRNLEWIENNRKKVEELSDGKLGYVYMSNTSGRGQLELVRHFYGQLDKEGFVIDERYNGGGQLADRFLELLQRPVTYNLHWRHGKDHTNPIKTNPGPMGMLINGSAGSGGDGLPWAFQELKAGPIVGERTLGILVGPATGHQLIDGGGITVPGARLYDNDGHWFWEGYGVSPDFEVWDDPSLMVNGRDPQMEKVVEEVMKLLKENNYEMTPAPELEDRTVEGFKAGKN